MLVFFPYRIRYRLPVRDPATSNDFVARNCARCSGESHCAKSARLRAVAPPLMTARHFLRSELATHTERSHMGDAECAASWSRRVSVIATLAADKARIE